MTDTKKPGFINARRRGFLQGAAVAGGAVAGGAAVAGNTLNESVDTLAVAEENTSGKKGYERTEHVSRYYARARF